MLGFYFKRVYLVPKQIRLLSVHLFGYILVILLFIAFIVWNGSIVVGDKSAHEAAIHLPQVTNSPHQTKLDTALMAHFFAVILF